MVIRNCRRRVPVSLSPCSPFAWSWSYASLLLSLRLSIGIFPDRIGHVVADGVCDPLNWVENPQHEWGRSVSRSYLTVHSISFASEPNLLCLRFTGLLRLREDLRGLPLELRRRRTRPLPSRHLQVQHREIHGEGGRRPSRPTSGVSAHRPRGGRSRRVPHA